MRPARRVSLKVENFPPIMKAELEVPVPGITVVVGPNASGKTRLFLSLHFIDSVIRYWKEFNRLRKGHELADALKRELREFFPWRLEKGWVIEMKELERRRKRSLYAKARVSYDHDGRLDVSVSVHRDSKLVPKRFVPSFRSLFTFLPMLTGMELPLAYRKFLLDLKTAQGAVVAKSECLSTRIRYSPQSGLTFERGGDVYSASEAASGWLELAPFELAVAMDKRPKAGRLIAVEEPEAHLHPDVTRCLVKYMTKQVSKGDAFLVSTHDPTFVEELNNLLVEGKIKSEKVKVYVMKVNKRGRSVTKELNVKDKYGIEYDPVVENLDKSFAEKLRPVTDRDDWYR